MTEYRLANPDELDRLKAFLFHHGANPWNHLPLDSVDNEFRIVASGKASALVAYSEENLVGLAIFYYPESLPKNYLEFSQGK
jgi:hypothetical protein